MTTFYKILFLTLVYNLVPEESGPIDDSRYGNPDDVEGLFKL